MSDVNKTSDASNLGRVYDATVQRQPKQDYDQDLFLKLLVAQMQYQDPLEPQDNSQFIGQMATFSQIEQLQQMSGAMEATQYYSLIGKGVVYAAGIDSAGNQIAQSAIVDGVQYTDGKYYLVIEGGKTLRLNDVLAVTDTISPDATNNVLNASHLVGKNVKAEFTQNKLDADGKPILVEGSTDKYETEKIKAEGKVTKIFNKEGIVYATVQGEGDQKWDVPVAYITEISE